MRGSLHTRILLAASFVLAAFLGLTGWTLDKAFRNALESAQQERLRGHIYTLLAGSDVGTRGILKGPEQLSDPRLNAPGSGLYAEISRRNRQIKWRSPSAVGVNIPPTTLPQHGQMHYDKAVLDDGTPIHVLSLGVVWEADRKKPMGYVFRVAETLDGMEAEIREFRKSLWGWLGGAALLLLLVQAFILRWGLRPLRRVAADVAAIESGAATQLTGDYPDELRALTDNLNALLASSNAYLTRYRNALGDLAHSLKTPLAVVRGTLEQNEILPTDRQLAQEQLERMNRNISYQLQRAATAGKGGLSSSVHLLEKATQLRSTLSKVYARKSVSCTIKIEPSLVFHGDEGDLLELLGNLMDNAYKWCGSRVEVSARALKDSPRSVFLLEIAFEDDGPGIALEQSESLMVRGARADPRKAGHGLGLDIVKSIVQAYAGKLEIGRSAMGGARVVLRF